MRKIPILILLILLCILPVRAEEGESLTVPDQNTLTDGLSEDASDLLEEIDISNPQIMDSVISIFTNALGKATDSLRQGIRTSGILLLISLLCSVIGNLSTRRSTIIIVGVLGIYGAVLGPVGAMIQLSRQTIQELADYSAILLPAMASAMAVSGSPITASGLQALTTLFSQLLMRLITNFLIPGIYLYLALVAAEAALQNKLLGEIREFLSWLMEKSLRISLYMYTIFLSITGVISGTSDQLVLKTTKNAVSGMVPVVGGILSDASESLITGASVIKNSIGVAGLLAVLSITIVPFIRVGLQYLLLKGTVACSGTIAMAEHTSMLKHISSAMGLLLGMTGTCSALLLISGVCCLKVATA